MQTDMFKASEGLSRRTRRRILRDGLGRANVVNDILPNSSLTTANNAKGMSGFWNDCPWAELVADSSRGHTFYDDFTDFVIPGTQTTAIWKGKYAVYAGSGAWANDAMPHSATAAAQGGVISALPGDNASVVIGTQACPFSLLTTLVGKLWFEARIATTSILTNAGQIFCGLGETAVTTYSATIPLGNANATSNAIAMIGFNRLEDGLGVLNTSYADHATSWTNIAAAANSTLAANTWIKLGMKVDFKDSTRCVRFYVDGIECATAMTKAALLALTSLDAVGLGPLLAFYGDLEGSDYIYIDDWRVAQTI